MSRRLTESDQFLDPRLEPAEDAAFRAIWRRRLRAIWRGEDWGIGPKDAASALQLPEGHLVRFLSKSFFGTAWAAIEAHSRTLRRRRVPVSDLPIQAARAGLLIAQLRLAAGRAHPADSLADALTG